MEQENTPVENSLDTHPAEGHAPDAGPEENGAEAGGPAGDEPAKNASEQVAGKPSGARPDAETVGQSSGKTSEDAQAGRHKAGILNRAIARFIDILVVLLLARLPGYIGFFAALTYIGIADGLMDGRSIGKRIIGLRVYCPEKGSAADFRDSILRNSTIGILFVVSVVPIVGWAVAAAGLLLELVLMIGSPEGKRLGDELASTVVVEEAHFRPMHAGDEPDH